MHVAYVAYATHATHAAYGAYATHAVYVTHAAYAVYATYAACATHAAYIAYAARSLSLNRLTSRHKRKKARRRWGCKFSYAICHAISDTKRCSKKKACMEKRRDMRKRRDTEDNAEAGRWCGGWRGRLTKLEQKEHREFENQLL